MLGGMCVPWSCTTTSIIGALLRHVWQDVVAYYAVNTGTTASSDGTTCLERVVTASSAQAATGLPAHLFGIYAGLMLRDLQHPQFSKGLMHAHGLLSVICSSCVSAASNQALKDDARSSIYKLMVMLNVGYRPIPLQHSNSYSLSCLRSMEAHRCGQAGLHLSHTDPHNRTTAAHRDVLQRTVCGLHHTLEVELISVHTRQARDSINPELMGMQQLQILLRVACCTYTSSCSLFCLCLVCTSMVLGGQVGSTMLEHDLFVAVLVAATTAVCCMLSYHAI